MIIFFIIGLYSCRKDNADYLLCKAEQSIRKNKGSVNLHNIVPKDHALPDLFLPEFHEAQ